MNAERSNGAFKMMIYIPCQEKYLVKTVAWTLSDLIVTEETLSS